MHPPPDALLRRLFPPMLATLVGSPEGLGDGYLYEVKYDGFRALCALSSGRVAMWTRNALDLTARFPHVAAALSRIVVGEAVIDGELCALDAAGVPRFGLLHEGDAALLFAFDLLWLDGADLRGRPLEERRDLLVSLLSNTGDPLRLAERVEGPADRALAEAARRGLEGVLAKERGSLYEPRRSRAWLKLKAQKSQELAIAGFTPSKRAGGAVREVGALLLAVKDRADAPLRFAGKVGTGFSSKLRRELLAQLERDRADAPQIEGAPRLRDAVWVTPKLVAQVEFMEWTDDGKLRHPSFQGLREDKTPDECIVEAAAPASDSALSAPRAAPSAPPAARARKPPRAPRSKRAKPSIESPAGDQQTEVTLSNPDRLLYPKDGITKADVARYFEAVSEPLLRALADRPLNIIHFNRGIHAEKARWLQQNIGDEAEPWMRLATIPTRTGRAVRHLVADRPAALRWLAQHSALEIHPWHSRDGSLESPDWVAFDLDPAEGQTIAQAVEAALALRELLDRLGVQSFPKTSGKRGLHVYVPLDPGNTYDDALAFALDVGQVLTRRLPGTTLERALADRRGRLYVDCMQNTFGKTLVAAYSLRGVDGAPVSTPLAWSEVEPKLDPARFNLRTLPARLAEVGDLFAPGIAGGARLPRAKR